MATKYENYITGDTQLKQAFGATWRAMSFTPSTQHSITSVKLKINRSGSPGTLTVSIRATSGGMPTGADLAVGTTNGNALTTSAFGDWYEIFLTPYTLAASTEYAIVIRVAGGDIADNNVAWRRDGTDATYAGGGSSTSTDSGGSWAEEGGGKPDGVTADYMFEDWGITVNVYPSDAVARVSSIRHIYRPGLYRMQVGCGDLGFDTDVAEATVRSELEFPFTPYPGQGKEFPGEVPPGFKMPERGPREGRRGEEFPGEVPPGFVMPEEPESVRQRRLARERQAISESLSTAKVTEERPLDIKPGILRRGYEYLRRKRREADASRLAREKRRRESRRGGGDFGRGIS